jgi:exonuclease SbcC
LYRLDDTDESPVSLQEISSGQRAAFVLSVFLAMNAKLKSGPPIVLLDDPVAHIDDFNALSFIDYLRELVLSRQRQVFYATADSRLAGLFEHKFGFLGDQFKRFNLQRP